MARDTELGSVVWHDLLSYDVESALGFYAELLGWKYKTEHASDFVWKEGEADYPLIIREGIAHGGFVEIAASLQQRWLPYVATQNVDSVTSKASVLGATIIREPFDIPSVGRASVIEDEGGAAIAPFVQAHSFPRPHGAFLWDELTTEDTASAAEFYGELFGWKVDPGTTTPYGTQIFRNTNDDIVAGLRPRPSKDHRSAIWLPYLAVNDLSEGVVKAKALGATLPSTHHIGSDARSASWLIDPFGTDFGLLASSTVCDT